MTSKIICMVFAAALPALSMAQERPAAAPSATEAALIQALVTEIRELRLSLERSQLLTLRFQAALQANQLHSERIKDLTAQLTLAKIQLTTATAQHAGLTEEIKAMERDSNIADPSLRQAAQQRLPAMKFDLERLSRQVSELSSQESQLASDLQRETVQAEDWRRWLQQFEQSIQPR